MGLTKFLFGEREKKIKYGKYYYWMTPPSKITANFNDLANSSSGNLNCGVSNYIDLCDQSESGAIEKYGSYEHKISSACEKIIEELPKGYRVEIFVKNEWGKI